MLRLATPILALYKPTLNVVLGGMRKLSKILISVVVILSGCALKETNLQRFEINVRSDAVSKETARDLALKYVALIQEPDYGGGTIKIDSCKELQTNGHCDYIVSHSGNGCGFVSFVKAQCSAIECFYTLSDPYEGNIICE